MQTTGLDDYTNLNALQTLKSGKSPGRDPATIHKVAAQFESLYVGMMMKSMREATRSLNPNDPMNSQQSKFYEDMFDSQMSVYLSERGGVGLRQVLERQLGGNPATPSTPLAKSAAHAAARTPLLPERAAPAIQAPAIQAVKSTEHRSASAPHTTDRQSFIDRIWPYARQAAAELGISARVILAQAVLETGWGQSLRRGLNNLFGIKADAAWSGESMHVPTLEVSPQGQLQRTHASFRNYTTIADSMRDYVHFMRSHPQFSKVIQSGKDEQAFIQHLGHSGYATDPHYALKLARILDVLPHGDRKLSDHVSGGGPDS